MSDIYQKIANRSLIIEISIQKGKYPTNNQNVHIYIEAIATGKSCLFTVKRNIPVSTALFRVANK